MTIKINNNYLTASCVGNLTTPVQCDRTVVQVKYSVDLIDKDKITKITMMTEYKFIQSLNKRGSLALCFF